MALYNETVGLKIEFNINIDIKDISEAYIIFLKPDKTRLEKPVLFENDKLTYITTSDVLDTVGVYKYQLKVILKSGYIGYDDIKTITIKKRI